VKVVSTELTSFEWVQQPTVRCKYWLGLQKPLRTSHNLTEKKPEWEGNWDKLLGRLQSEIFKRAIKNNVKREDKIKEDSQLSQNRTNKKLATLFPLSTLLTREPSIAS
jgi:hypothetical protein